MLELSPDSDLEIGSETLNSSHSSMSSAGSCDRCSSFSRLSFDASASAPAAAAAAAAAAGSPSPPTPRAGAKPHRASDPAWAAIRSRRGGAAALGPRDFKLIRRIGSGDIGTVYLCRLRDEPRCPAAAGAAAPTPAPAQFLYAMKVVDKMAIAKKKKLERAATERRILRVLDHPFLPSLYADFDASPHYSCVVMEYCCGGDLHSLRHRQPALRFSLSAARFYAAEVLLALEYLHMLGIVYRDLKPENILIRSDGHIMLSDFDLSLVSTSSPTVERLGPTNPTPSTAAAADSASSDVPAPAPHPDPSCLPDQLFRPRKRRGPDRRFVAEPIAARSESFVGTHEYVAPEVASGGPHGSAVDWWAYGVLLFELLYGRTPFAGPTTDATLRNIVRQPLAFPHPHPPTGPAGSPAARDLIGRLLAKDPTARLGSRRGAADVKSHPFFKGLNFALLRTHRPPVVPGPPRSASSHDRDRPPRFDFF